LAWLRLRMSVAKPTVLNFVAKTISEYCVRIHSFKRITEEPQELSWNNLAHDTRPPLTHLGPMTLKVTLPNGMLVTNPEQFTG
jgi:hypothetical protein